MKNNKRLADYISVEEAAILAGSVYTCDCFHAAEIYHAALTEMGSETLAIGAVFQAGYIAGKRAEREKRQQEGNDED